MSGAWELRIALLEALRNDAEIMSRVHGVFDERPKLATPPYIELLSSISSDWSSKSFSGREIRLTVALHTTEQENSPDLSALQFIEACIEDMPTTLPSYKIINRQYLRSRSGHDEDGRWTILVDYRLRLQRLK